MNYTLKAAFLLIFFSVVACQSEEENLILGKWQATEITEQDSILDMNLQEIWFTFDAENRYAFHSTLNYREAGKYEYQEPLLYTTDTLNVDSQRKAVKVLTLDHHKLILEMNDEGKKRTLELSKQKTAQME